MTGDKARRVVLIGGVGTVGSPVVELLAREQPDVVLILVDHDIVLAHNVAKSALYQRSDIGQRKVLAAAWHLRDIAPDVHVVPVAQPLQTLGVGPFRLASVAFAALDDRLAKFAWNRACQAAAVSRALIAELEGCGSSAARLRAFAPVLTGDRGPCLECGWSAQDYAVLGRLSQPCNRPAEAGSDGEGQPPSGRFSPALRLAAECVEEIERCLAGRPTLAPGEELRMLPEQRRYMVLRTRPREDCLCPHGAPQPQSAITGTAQTLRVGDFVSQADTALGRGWTWHGADGIERRADDLAQHAERRLADLWPPGDLLRMTSAADETAWLALPTDGLLAWLADLEISV